MEQRPLRLGDIVDDYCPRERRITNHAIVALVDDTIKQTRCTTCEHEHVYKEAREPKRRKKNEAAVLYSQVLSGLQKTPAGAPAVDKADEADEAEEPIEVPPPAAAAPPETIAPVVPVEPIAPIAAVAEAQAQDQVQDVEDEDQDGPNGNTLSDDEPWSMHRRLIRAQLPRNGNEPPPARPLPDFTIRQPGSRGGGQRPWRGGNANGNNANGNRQGRGGHGQGGGQRPGRGGRFAQGNNRPDGSRRGGHGGGGGRPGGGGRGRRSR